MQEDDHFDIEYVLKQTRRRYSIRDLIENKAISEGMIPKVEAALRASELGVEAVHIIDGRVENSLLLEVLTDSGIGTMIRA